MSRSYSFSEVGELEDSVCRAEHSAALALRLVEELTGGGEEAQAIPLTKDERELLYFAVAEASDYAGGLKARYYELLDGTLGVEGPSTRP